MEFHQSVTVLLTCLMLGQSILGSCRCILVEVLHEAGGFPESEAHGCSPSHIPPTLSTTQTCDHEGPECPEHGAPRPDHDHAPQFVLDELKPADADLQLAVCGVLTELVSTSPSRCRLEPVPPATVRAASPPLYLTLQNWLI